MTSSTREFKTNPTTNETIGEVKTKPATNETTSSTSEVKITPATNKIRRNFETNFNPIEEKKLRTEVTEKVLDIMDIVKEKDPGKALKKKFQAYSLDHRTSDAHIKTVLSALNYLCNNRHLSENLIVKANSMAHALAHEAMKYGDARAIYTIADLFTYSKNRTDVYGPFSGIRAAAGRMSDKSVMDNYFKDEEKIKAIIFLIKEIDGRRERDFFSDAVHSAWREALDNIQKTLLAVPVTFHRIPISHTFFSNSSSSSSSSSESLSSSPSPAIYHGPK